MALILERALWAGKRGLRTLRSWASLALVWVHGGFWPWDLGSNLPCHYLSDGREVALVSGPPFPHGSYSFQGCCGLGKVAGPL